MFSPISFFFFYSSGNHRDLHSFPTRRSSDLSAQNGPIPSLRSTAFSSGPTKPNNGHWSCDLAPAERYVCRIVLKEKAADARSEEHTSELQSRLHLVCRLLLEKKKKKNNDKYT